MAISLLFESLLEETTVSAIRHFTPEEADGVVAQIKRAITSYVNFDIVDRDKNRDFMKAEKLDKNISKQIIMKFLEPSQMVAVLQDRNHPDNELYLFSVEVPMPNNKKRYIYLKVSMNKHGKVSAISWHNQNEKIHVDYRKAQDETDSSMILSMGKAWKYLFNKVHNNRNGIKMVTTYADGENITLVFNEPVNDDNDDEIIDVCRSVPKDFGMRFKDVQSNMSFNHGDIVVHVKPRQY